MTVSPLASFLLPEGYTRPRVGAVLREGSVVTEAGRLALHSASGLRRRRSTGYVQRLAPRQAEPVLLVPGFLAGDGTLSLMSRALRHRGFRTYRSHIHANIGCTLNAADQLETRLEAIVQRRESRVQIVGHSLGGMLARGVAARRPDLVSGIVTMGSPILAPGAHHVGLSRGVEMLVRLSAAGVPGLMAEDCVSGACARQSFDESNSPLDLDIDVTSIYSKRDGVVDWRACIDPLATPVEVTASHVGMALDPRVIDLVDASLRRHCATTVGSVIEINRGKSA